MTEIASEIENVSNLLLSHLKLNNIESLNTGWRIENSSLGGRGLFAAKDISAGELMFVDYPLLTGPRVSATYTEKMCIYCYKITNLRACSRYCGLLVCGDSCENSTKHLNDCKKLREWDIKYTPAIYEKLTKCMAPVHAFSLNKIEFDLLHQLKAHHQLKHGMEVDVLKQALMLNINHAEEIYLRQICAILDANAFETIIDKNDECSVSVRAIYPLAALVNHSCVPNIAFVFDCKQFMIARAIVNIKKNEEILHCYNKVLWGTLTRRYHLLKTKYFSCACTRCGDPTEFGTYMSAVLCRKCPDGYVIPMDSLRMNSKWCCNQCGDIQDAKEMGFKYSILGGRLETLYEVDDIFDFLNNKLKDIVPVKCNQIAIDLKYRLIWMLGNRKGYSMNDLTEDLLHFKEETCKELLNLLSQLKIGECKLKGLILYALYTCRLEKYRRLNRDLKPFNSADIQEEIKNLLDASSSILMYDVGAPTEIKKQWKNRSIVETITQ